MSSSVIVLCSNGRRVTVKIGPNAPLMQVLEQACKKQSCNPDLYTLREGKRNVDLSCPYRFSGLINNAKLELVPLEKPRVGGGNLEIVVQTEGGRTHGSFPSTTPLSTVMEQLGMGGEREGYEPALVYMRQQVTGRERLTGTCLKDLGLSQGKATLRLSYVKIDTIQHEPSKLNVMPTSIEGAEVSAEGPQISTKGSEVSTKGSEVLTKGSEVSTKGSEVSTEESQAENHDTGPSGHSEDMEVETKPVTTPIIDTPSIDEISFPVLPIASVFGPDEGAELLQERVEPPAQPMDYTEQEVDMAKAIAQYIKQSWEVENLQRQTSAEAKKKVYEEPCDRQPIIYHLDAIPTTPIEDLPEAFFDITKSDVQKMQEDLRRQVQIDVPLTTQSHKQMVAGAKLSTYTTTTIRVMLPDRWVLQGFFNSGESLKSLVQFVRDHMADPAQKFYLYTTPPKEILKSSRPTFSEAGFVPAANIHFSPQEEVGNEQTYLSHESIEKYGGKMDDADIKASQARPQTSKRTVEITSTGMSLEEPSSDVPKSKPVTGTKKQPGKQGAPKWFRAGK